MVAILQALQRLSTSPFASAEAEALVACAAGKCVFGALSCGHAAVAAKAARLLMRLWAPAVRHKSNPDTNQIVVFSLACVHGEAATCSGRQLYAANRSPKSNGPLVGLRSCGGSHMLPVLEQFLQLPALHSPPPPVTRLGLSPGPGRHTPIHTHCYTVHQFKHDKGTPLPPRSRPQAAISSLLHVSSAPGVNSCWKGFEHGQIHLATSVICFRLGYHPDANELVRSTVCL